jgi:hypothetical protein
MPETHSPTAGAFRLGRVLPPMIPIFNIFGVASRMLAGYSKESTIHKCLKRTPIRYWSFVEFLETYFCGCTTAVERAWVI